MKRILGLVLVTAWLAILPLHSLAVGNWSFSGLAERTPRLSADRKTAEVNERFYLSWHVDGAEKVALKRKTGGTTYSVVPGGADLPAQMSRYAVSVPEAGTYEFFIDAWIGGSVVRSSPVTVSVSDGFRHTGQNGMDKVWRIQAMIFRSVQTKAFKKTFTQAQVDHIKNLLSVLPGTLFNLSDGRMCAVVTDVFEIIEPIRSVSGSQADLIPEKDFPLNGYLCGDTTLLAVFAPLDGYPKMGWLGLGGYTYTYRGHTFYMTEFSSHLPSDKTWIRNGIRYDRGTSALVHEILHAVEVNSDKNGWSGFQKVHSAEANGYRDQADWLDYYSDLMTDSLKNGRAGFREISFYVPQGGAARSRAGQ